MKIGSPKNLEGKNLLVGVSAVDSNGNAIGSDITTLKNGANVTFTSSANGVLVIDARSVTSVENATSAVYATNAISAISAGSLTNAITINGVALNGGTTKTLADLNIASKTHTHTHHQRRYGTSCLHFHDGNPYGRYNAPCAYRFWCCWTGAYQDGRRSGVERLRDR